MMTATKTIREAYRNKGSHRTLVYRGARGWHLTALVDPSGNRTWHRFKTVERARAWWAAQRKALVAAGYDRRPEPTPAADPKPRRFERETCSRCGGTGHYSYCPRYGTTCFRCGGAGETLTRRGEPARDRRRALCSRPASTLKPGDQIHDHGMTVGGDPFPAWFTVQTIAPYTPDAPMTVDGVTIPAGPLLKIELTSKRAGPLTMMGVPPKQLFRVLGTPTEERTALAAALDYQDTLTRSGTPSKR